MTPQWMAERLAMCSTSAVYQHLAAKNDDQSLYFKMHEPPLGPALLDRHWDAVPIHRTRPPDPIV